MTQAGKTFRGFVAIELPEDIISRLRQLLEALRQADSSDAVRWVRPEGVHLTLKFLGDTPESQASEIEQALRSAVARHQGFRLRLGRPGTFSGGRPRQVRVVWVGLEGDLEALAALQRDVEQALAPLGYPPEGRAFQPHLTLGRAREGRTVSGDLVSRAEGEGPGAAVAKGFRVTGVSLMESALLPDGAQYTRRFLISLA
jgi:2'-5' RNA ligase